MLARCRMYTSWQEVRDGYAKSLAVGLTIPLGILFTLFLMLLYVFPAVAGLAGVLPGAVGYLAAASGRFVTARASGDRAWPDALLHPVSIVLFAVIMIHSIRQELSGTRTWKGRSVHVGS
jgi:ABC-type uncharacterized transport system YnjBCD permease subunit